MELIDFEPEHLENIDPLDDFVAEHKDELIKYFKDNKIEFAKTLIEDGKVYACAGVQRVGDIGIAWGVYDKKVGMATRAVLRLIKVYEEKCGEFEKIITTMRKNWPIGIKFLEHTGWKFSHELDNGLLVYKR